MRRKAAVPVVGTCRIINSPTLGEAILVASEDFVLQLDEDGLYKGMAVYRESEWAALRAGGLSKAHVRAVHEVKKWGWCKVEGVEE